MIGEITLKNGENEVKLTFNTFSVARICELLDLDFPEDVIQNKLNIKTIIGLVQAGIEGNKCEFIDKKEVYQAVDSLGGVASIDWTLLLDAYTKSIFSEALYNKLKEAKEQPSEEATPKKKSTGKKLKSLPLAS